MNLEKLKKEIEKEYPLFLRGTDLIELGLFKSRTELSVAIKKNQAPPYIRLGEMKIVFLRVGLLDWLESKFLKEQMKNVEK